MTFEDKEVYNFLLRDNDTMKYYIIDDTEITLTGDALVATSYETVEEAHEAKICLCGYMGLGLGAVVIVAG